MSWSRIAASNSFPFLLFGLFQTVLKNLLLRNFQGSVVYCSVIKVLCFSLSVQATALIDYHIVSCLSTTFLTFYSSTFYSSKFFVVSIHSRCSPCKSQKNVSHTFGIERNIPFVSQRQPSPGLQIFLCFVPVPSATKTILPSSPLIVNVFLVFYLFHAIQTIIGFPGFKRNNCRIFLLLPSSFDYFG